MTDLRKPNPQKRRVQRVSGEQDLSVGSAPTFSTAKINKITNLMSISSHTYIKQVSEKGGGFSLFKGADNTYTLVVDKILIRRNGYINTSKEVDPLGSDSDYVNIQDNQIVVSRPDDDGVGAAGAFYGVSGGGASNSNGLLGSSTGSGVGVQAIAEGTGDAITTVTNGGYAIQGSGGIKLTGASIYLGEKASAEADAGGFGQLWVKNTTPCELWFTKDDGTDVQIS